MPQIKELSPILEQCRKWEWVWDGKERLGMWTQNYLGLGDFQPQEIIFTGWNEFNFHGTKKERKM